MTMPKTNRKKPRRTEETENGVSLSWFLRAAYISAASTCRKAFAGWGKPIALD